MDCLDLREMDPGAKWTKCGAGLAVVTTLAAGLYVLGEPDHHDPFPLDEATAVQLVQLEREAARSRDLTKGAEFWRAYLRDQVLNQIYPHCLNSSGQPSVPIDRSDWAVPSSMSTVFVCGGNEWHLVDKGGPTATFETSCGALGIYSCPYTLAMPEESQVSAAR